MIVVPQIAFHGDQVALGDDLPPVRTARELAARGASEISLLDLDGTLASESVPEWVQTLVATTTVPLRFDGRLHDGLRIERVARAGFGTVVVDQMAVFEPILLRWALDLFGPRLCVEVQVDGEYVFDAPPAAFGRELVDVLSGLHLQGARRILYRDVTGEAVPVQRLLELGDRVPGVRVTYQGPLRSIDDVASLALVGPAIEAVNVEAAHLVDGTIDLVSANRAAAAARRA